MSPTETVRATCHECDLKVTFRPLRDGQRAGCPRCGYTITRRYARSSSCLSAISVGSIIALIFANLFPFIELNVQGQQRSMTLIGLVRHLFVEDHLALGIIVTMVIFVLPLLFVVALNGLMLSIRIGRVTPRSFLLLRAVHLFQFWNMAEIYFLGVLISMIKVSSLADIWLGPAFWFFAVFCASLVAAIQYIDCFQLARQARQQLETRSDLSIGSAQAGGALRECAQCGAPQKSVQRQCKVCGTAGRPQKHESLQRTWAYLLTGIALYIPANILPIMHTLSMGSTDSNNIVGGVLLLWSHGSYPIAIVIFVASVAVPIGKFLALLVLLMGEQFGSKRHPQARVKLYRTIELVGRWSMVDVFVVAFLAGLIQIGNLMAIIPGPAVLSFAGMVVFTMLAADSFESALFWESDD
jgi:paraquat-inducible protein A